MTKNVNNIVSDGLKQAQHQAVFQIGGGLALYGFKKAKEVVTTKIEERKARKADEETLASE